MDPRSWRAAVATAALVTITGCAGGSGGVATPTATRSTASAAPMPDCADVGAAVELPSAFPAAFPLPAGTVFDEVRQAGGSVVVSGVVPLAFEDATRYLADRFPGSGLELGESDSEAGEAEAEFSGAGVSGRWKLHEISGCDGASTLSVSVEG